MEVAKLLKEVSVRSGVGSGSSSQSENILSWYCWHLGVVKAISLGCSMALLIQIILLQKNIVNASDLIPWSLRNLSRNWKLEEQAEERKIKMDNDKIYEGKRKIIFVTLVEVWTILWMRIKVCINVGITKHSRLTSWLITSCLHFTVTWFSLSNFRCWIIEIESFSSIIMK